MPLVSPTPILVSLVSTTSFTPSAPIQRQFALDRTNPLYTRNATLTQDGLYLQFYTASVVIPLSNLYQQCITILPSITWPPVIVTQPTNSIVTHPAKANFTLSASAETSITYQWYSSSFSQSGTFYPLTSSGVFTGSATPALTMSSTTTNMNASQFYCLASNVSGFTTSSIVISTIS